ncbi:MAG TPA: maleylpyruvate isomerase N-terminal domain-containing protein [Candidatus Binatia bacterium]|nr:maleylpyruvate isomerase N-terminal domain-containing protein [Candidatus Binatia bacterium]
MSASVTDGDELADLDPFDLMDAEAARIDAHLSRLDPGGWLEPSRCRGWRVREVVAHLAASEEYNHATLDGSVAELMARFQAREVTSLDAINDLGVRERADRTPVALLDEWRPAAAETRRRLRERGREGMLDTSVGPYPAGRQGFHLASELAIHADDIGVPVAAEERRQRPAWRARVARSIVREYDRPVRIEASAGMNRVVGTDGAVEAEIDDETLVEACAARLPEDHPLDRRLREDLRVLA